MTVIWYSTMSLKTARKRWWQSRAQGACLGGKLRVSSVLTTKRVYGPYRCLQVVPLSFMRICTSSIPLPPTPPLVSDTPTSPGSPRTPDYSTSDCTEDLGISADLLRSRLAEAAAALEVSANAKCNLKKRRRGDGYDDDGKPPASNLYYSSGSEKLKSMNNVPSLVYGPGCLQVFCKDCIIETQDG